MDRNKKIIKTSIWGIIVNIILVAFKASIGLIVNSIAIILDAVNNLSDALSSIITIIGTKLSGRKPDKKHPYGYGRIEYFSSIIIAVLVMVAGITALKESIEKIIHPEAAEYTIPSLIIIAVAVVVKFVFGRYVKKVGETINSQSLVASGTDAFMDAVLSFTTLVAGIVSLVWGLSLEGYLGVVISIIIIKSSIDMLRETVNSMIGARFDSELTKKLRSRIMEFNKVEGVYDLVLHDYGPSNIMGAVHIQVQDNMTAKQLHKLTREITYAIYNEYGIVLTIGIYAANDNGEYGEIKKELVMIVNNYMEVLQIHGFYVDEETNSISFDLIIDFKAENPEEIKNRVLDDIKDKYPNYNYYVILDTDISD